MRLHVKSPRPDIHREVLSFIWSDKLPIDLAAIEAAKVYGYTDVDKWTWGLTKPAGGGTIPTTGVIGEIFTENELIELYAVAKAA